MLSMVHDLAESIVGDITPQDPITKDEKRELEEVQRVSETASSSDTK